MRYLITGTGRCGTGFAAKLLTSAGITCSHEGVFNLYGWSNACCKIERQRKCPEEGWLADSSWMAAPHISRPELHAVTVVHLVREPRLVIRSMLRMGFFSIKKYSPYTNYANCFAPYMERYEKPLEKAAYLYLKLNWMVEERADIFHRIEDEPWLLLDKLGIDHHGKELFDNRTYNSRSDYSDEEVDLNELPMHLFEEIEQMGERYGY